MVTLCTIGEENTMNIVTVIVVSLCAITPFIVAIVVYVIVIYPARYASAIKYLKEYQANELSQPIKAKRPVTLTIFVIVSMIGICLLIGLLVSMIVWYLNIPLHLPW